ncbi:MAG: hypothetical protein MJK04_15445 [Psychrosphaera sp.]|nr:hypothetical protein [Psychrosphaera sp.]
MLGRFWSNDPVGFRDVHCFNRYAYANNNPYKFVDPDGNNPKLIGDFVLNVTINYLTTGSPGLAMAARETIEGAFNPAKTLKSIDKVYKLLKKQGTVGSYTITFGNGKQYHGKGPLKRMEQSAKDKGGKNGGAENAKWDEAMDDKSAFKDEAKKIANDKDGVRNPNNLNIRNSPGKNMLKTEQRSNSSTSTSGSTTRAASKQKSNWL